MRFVDIAASVRKRKGAEKPVALKLVGILYNYSWDGAQAAAVYICVYLLNVMQAGTVYILMCIHTLFRCHPGGCPV